MKTNHKYEEVIRHKLQQVPLPDTNALWSRMEEVLDVEMPVKKSRPRVIPFGSNMLVWVGAAVITAIVITKSMSVSPSEVSAEMNRQQIAQQQQQENKQQNTSTTPAEKVTVDNNTNTSNTVATTKSFNFNNYIVSNNNSTPNNFQQHNIPAIPVNANTSQLTGSDLTSKNSVGFIAGTQFSSLVNFNAGSATPTPFLAMQPKPRKNSWMNNVVLGGSFNYNVPVDGQRMNFFKGSNKNTIVYDFLPSVFAQYNLSKKLYVQAEVQFISPQYASNQTLYNKESFLNPDEKETDIVKLNKLYYMNIPVSLHYSPIPQVSIGAGVQFSKLKQMVLTNEQYYSVKRGTGWNTSLTAKETLLRSVPDEEAKNFMSSSVDTVAAAFKPTDTRIVLDAGYNVDRFNIGVRYTKGMNGNFDNGISPHALPQQKNQSVQLYLKVNLFDKRKY